MNTTQDPSSAESPTPLLQARRPRFRHLLGSKWLDWLMPWQAPLKSGQQESQDRHRYEQVCEIKQRLITADLVTLKDALSNVEKLAEAQDERRRGVETRLSTIVGLTSIAATLATGLLVAQAAGTLKLPAGWLRWGFVLLGIYLVIQLCDAIWWAIRGQSRASYLQDGIVGLIREPGTSEEAWLRERVSLKVTQLLVNTEQVNKKVTSMAVAHHATQNFVWGLLLLSLLGLLATFRAPDERFAMQTIRADADLRELLRGPVGPLGPQGEAGPRGPQGPVGKPGEPSTSCNCSSESVPQVGR